MFVFVSTRNVREIDGSFSPLVFSTTGGMGTVATVVYKRLAPMIIEKHGKPYSSNFPQVIVKSYVYTACVTGTFVLPRTCT